MEDDKIVQHDLNPNENAESYSLKRKNWIGRCALAACLCLVAAGTIAFLLHLGRREKPEFSLSTQEQSYRDMIGFFIYQGRCYVQNTWTDNIDIVGEYLGTATGSIDEWTPQDGYVDFAGSVKGDFFSVKGYDPSFLLCIMHPTGQVETYICNNGINLKYGNELYEDRFHLSEYYDFVQYETYDSWNYSENELYRINGKNEIIDGFIKEIDRAEFIPWTDAVEKEGKTDISIYDTELYHLYYYSENGMSTAVRIYENGYVRSQGFMDVCVKVPEDCFDALVNLLDKHAGSEPVPVTDPVAENMTKCKNDPELGRYVPEYEIPQSNLIYANVFYKIEPKTAVISGTESINAEYNCETDPYLYYRILVFREEDIDKYGFDGIITDSSELSVEVMEECIELNANSGRTYIDACVKYDDVLVVLSGSGINAEDAFMIFNSVN